MRNVIYSIVGGLIAVFVYVSFFEKTETERIIVKPQTDFYSVGFKPNEEPPNFRNSVKKSINSVVFIKTRYSDKSNSLYDLLFDESSPFPLEAEGSGVIISPDGYIVTNYHVVEKSTKIQVVLNDKRAFKAKIIGLDPTTDLALLKINSEDLPFAEFGDSDNLEIGDWVLAIGNPYNLQTTVTAGIISAKSRSINIIDKRSAVEAFLQTDAAVNPGNSGGALVDIDGNLIGINTAIASRTGSYIGYSFAVPINIVKKVITDIREYGKVQRAVLGIKIDEITAEFARKTGIKKIEGIYISSVEKKSAAEKAGLLVDDILLSLENVRLNSSSELYEQLARYRPGDEVELMIKRKGKLLKIKATLTNLDGKASLEPSKLLDLLGAEYEQISEKQMNDLEIQTGLKIKKLSAGKLLDAKVKEGFIIQTLNNELINSVSDLEEALKNSSSAIFIEGIYPDGEKAYYAFGLK